MRRDGIRVLAALALGAVVMLVAAGLSGGALGTSTLVPIHVAERVAARFGHTLASALACGVRTAGAQEVLEFKPVPPGSTSALEEPGRRAARRPAPPAEPAAPEPPTPPEPPAAPVDPDMLVTKSGDIMRIGSDIEVGRYEVVTGDLLAVGGDIRVEGHVEGDVVAMGGNVDLAATARVDGDVASIGGELSEEPGAYVGGQRVTASGIRDRKWRGHVARAPFRGLARAGHVASSMVWLLIMLAVAWAFTALAPGRSNTALQTLKREPALSLGIGALVWALVIPSIVALALVVAILCITIIGIPLALAAMLGYSVFLAVLGVWGYVVGTLAIGDWASGRIQSAAPAPAAAPTGVAAPGPTAGGVAAPAAMSLTRRAVLGVLIVSGAGLAGELLQTLTFLPPIHGFGVFVSVVSVVGGALAATFGAGALMRSEIKSGTLGRWWSGRRSAPAAAPSPAPAPEAAPPSGAESPGSPEGPPPPAIG